MAGIIADATTQTPATTAQTLAPSTYAASTLPDPTKWTTTPEQTVAGQITNLTDPNSGLIQQARTRADQNMNARGLRNSSIAATAADSAAYDAAMPIAQADAAQASKVAGYNTQTQNEANQFNATAQNQAGQFNTTQLNQARTQDVAQQNTQANMNLGSTLDLTKMSAQQQNELGRMAAQQGFNLQTMNAQQLNDLQKMDKTYTAAQRAAQEKFGYDKDLMALQAAATRETNSLASTYSALLQGSASATSIMNNTQNKIADIIANTTMDATAKQAAIDIYNNNAKTALSIIGGLAGDVDLSSIMNGLFGKTATPAATAPAAPTAPAANLPGDQTGASGA